jgi:hypothetical protein
MKSFSNHSEKAMNTSKPLHALLPSETRYLLPPPTEVSDPFNLTSSSRSLELFLRDLQAPPNTTKLSLPNVGSMLELKQDSDPFLWSIPPQVEVQTKFYAQVISQPKLVMDQPNKRKRVPVTKSEAITKKRKIQTNQFKFLYKNPQRTDSK